MTEISVDNNGNCVWSGPATFKANCGLNITEWPFDSQSCELGFGSFTYGIDRMNIKLFQDTKGGGQFTSKYSVPGLFVHTCTSIVLSNQAKAHFENE